MTAEEIAEAVNKMSDFEREELVYLLSGDSVGSMFYDMERRMRGGR